MGSDWKKKKRAERNAKVKSKRQQQPSVIPPRPPRRIFVDYQDPQQLRILGPLIVAVWEIPLALSQALIAVGQPIPQPIVGHMLIDTGASATCMSMDVAAELGLKPVGLVNGYGASGSHKNQVYHALLKIRIVDQSRPDKGHLEIASEQRVQGIPELHRSMDSLKPTTNGKPIRLVGLLGRDFLRHTRFHYDGDGNFEVIIKTETLAVPTPAISLPS